ncbi:granulocyte-macrophage colony-stimulating factor receptor subunit alpha-like, partial [Plectropomus leopardus]|uniref:granulocyte-macrophage colony-stimulating factor receptor subunit alpha-like n=1 Tax=Plectropomus leopardus TaxID=160734 RepID=UPI001C4BA60F
MLCVSLVFDHHLLEEDQYLTGWSLPVDVCVPHLNQTQSKCLQSLTVTDSERLSRNNRRLVMKVFPLHPILWSSVLVLCASHSETEANGADVCQEEKVPGDIYPQSPSWQAHDVEETEVNGNFHCLLYPTNTLNCSWWFTTLQRDTRLFVQISVCDDDRTVRSLNALSEERIGSKSLHLHDKANYVILRFNMTLHDEWTVYTCTYHMDMIEVLSPPQNINASIKDRDLLVSWSLPHSREDSTPLCFEYQLDMGDQERPRNVSEHLSYTEPNADPTCTYSVRLRARKKDTCQKSSQWSEWSHAV